MNAGEREARVKVFERHNRDAVRAAKELGMRPEALVQWLKLNGRWQPKSVNGRPRKVPAG